MKKIIFFTNKNISHITPIIPLIEGLLVNNEVWCLGEKKFKDIIASTGAHFVEFPEKYYELNNKFYLNLIDDEIKKVIKFNDLDKYIYNILKRDIASIYKKDSKEILEILEKCKKINPDYIFRDSVDKTGKIIANLLNIECIGYITNSVYSKKFIEKDFENLYYCFLRFIKMEVLNGKNSTWFYNMVEKINSEIAKDLNVFEIPVYGQYDPNEKRNLVFSTQFLQPYEFNQNNEYFIIPPSISRIEKESSKNINNKLKNFIEKNTNKKIVYIATGSFVTREKDFYKKLINFFIKINYSVIVSWKIDDDYKKEIIKEIGDKKIYIEDFVNQCYVLKYSNLFITAGGLNSIIESIYFKVPMLIVPLSSEQTLNGRIIENLNMGRLATLNRKIYKTTGELILEIEQDKNIIINLTNYSKKLRKYNQQKEILNFIKKL